MTNGTEPETMTAKQAAALLGHQTTAYLISELLPTGQIDGYQGSNGIWHVSRPSVVAYLETRPAGGYSRQPKVKNPKFSNGAFPEHVSPGAKAANRLLLQLRIRARNPEKAVYYDSSGKEVKHQEWLEAGKKKRHLGGVSRLD